MTTSLTTLRLSAAEAAQWQFSSCCIDLEQSDPGEESWKLLTRLALGLVFSMDTMMMSLLLCAEEHLLAIAASLETASEHALAQSVVRYARERGILVHAVRDFRAFPGLGVRGVVEASFSPEGNRDTETAKQAASPVHSVTVSPCHPTDAAVGSIRLMGRLGWPMAASLEAEKVRLEASGRSVVCVGWEGQVRGLLAFAEELRPEAAEVVRELSAAGLAVEALTGDDRAAGEALARRLGIPVHSNLLPDDKQRLLSAAQRRLGPVVMVGDGLNDAPALAHADVGIALGCGVDVTREAADVSLIGSDLRQVAATLRLARQTYRTIRQNLWWAFLYNGIGIGLAVVGVLHPIVSALAMVVSNLFVVGNSLRLARQTE